MAQDAKVVDWNFPGGRASAFLVSAIADHALGSHVEIAPPLAVPVLWEALDRGDGEVDIHTEVWLPNQGGLVDTYVKEKGSVVLSDLSWQGVQGYCVTPAAIEQGITSVFDLSNPENAELFDTNGDGKGEIWVGSEGWQSTNIERVRARDYGIEEFFELQSAEESVAVASLDRAFKAGKPWVGYCYGPHHNFTLYNLTLLDEPAHDPDKFVMVQPNADPDWYNLSKVASAYPELTIRIGYVKDLKDKQPSLMQLLENIQLNADDINAFSYELMVNGRDPAEVAQEWVEANSDLIKSWVGN
jgi:glycine betaine/proline transport system substrate-binding protein